MNYNECRKYINEIIAVHDSIILGYAKTFEESLIYMNDTNVLVKFTNIRNSFNEVINKIFIIKNQFDASRYDNTFNIIEEYKKLINSYISQMDDVTNQIKNAINLAYLEYVEEFNEIEKDWQLIKEATDQQFTIYLTNKTKKQRTLNERNIARIEEVRDENYISSLNKEIKVCDTAMEGALNAIRENIQLLARYNESMNELLEVALKKSTVTATQLI